MRHIERCTAKTKSLGGFAGGQGQGAKCAAMKAVEEGNVFLAAAGKGRVLTKAELNELIDKLGFEPTIQKLN